MRNYLVTLNEHHFSKFPLHNQLEQKYIHVSSQKYKVYAVIDVERSLFSEGERNLLIR